MPRGDRTGPRGMGSMTGRAAGYCAGYDAPGVANPAMGGGYGGGAGRRAGGGGGFGRRNRFYATGVPGWAAYPPAWDAPPPVPPAPPSMSREQEVDMLKAQLERINARLNDLEQD